MNAPTIVTERLMLVAPQASFFKAHCEMMADPRVAAWVGGGTSPSRLETWRRYCQGAGLWPLLGYGYWTVLDRVSARPIGFGGVADFERGVPELEGFPEAGWAFAAEWWGRGIATEFVAALTSWTDSSMPASEVRCLIDPRNGASLRVAEKACFTAVAEVAHDGLNSIVHARQKSRDS